MENRPLISSSVLPLASWANMWRSTITKVVADELEFAESKAASQKAGNGQNENTGQQSYGDGFEPLGDDEGLPFT